LVTCFDFSKPSSNHYLILSYHYLTHGHGAFSTGLKIIVGPTKEDNDIWRIKTNKELDELIKHWNIINCVKYKRFGWFGHINRMPETCIVRKIYKWKQFTSRTVGRPKPRWEDDVRNDVRSMKFIKWTEQVQDRLKWKDIVEKAKTLPEL
jgi:hypothetical protein